MLAAGRALDTSAGAALMSALASALSRVLPAKQVVTDPLRRLAYGTDASFYRLIPEVVAVVESEAEVQALCCRRRVNRAAA
jgi:D-lactate dehydrogenase